MSLTLKKYHELEKKAGNPIDMMGNKTWKLSDKIDEQVNEDNVIQAKVVWVGDVKEFIKRLKELSRKIKGVEGDWINVEMLEKLAGDER